MESIGPTIASGLYFTHDIALPLSWPGLRACLILLSDGSISRTGIQLEIRVECLM